MPSYCILRKSTYYFQQIVPDDLVHVIGKKKIVFSLNTGNKRHAESLAKPLASQNKLLWDELRQQELSEPLDPMWLTERCKGYIFEKIKSDALQSQRWLNNIYQRHGNYFASCKKFEQVKNELGLQVLREAQADPCLVCGKPTEKPYQSIKEDYESFLNFWQLNIKPDSSAFLHANKVLLDYLVVAQNIRIAQTEGNVIEEGNLLQSLFPTGSPTVTPKQQTITSLPAELPKSSNTTPPAPSSLQDTTPCVSKLFECWKREHLKSGKTEDTVREYEGYLKRFVELVGDLAVTDVEPKHIREFKDALLSFPTYPKRYNVKSATELVALCKADSSIQTLSPKTINGKYLSAIRAVLSYAVTNGYIASNPSQNIKATVGTKKSYKPFTSTDLKTLFASPAFTEGYRSDSAGKDALFWIPLIGLYTGARLEEIGQLLVNDIKEEDGIHYFDLLTEEEKASGTKQRFKTESSKRKVPIHSRLIKIGFLDYVASLRTFGDKQLFPHLKEYQGKMTKYFSKTWGIYLKRHLADSDGKVFHSFRHTLKDAFREAEVPMDIADRIQGHALRSEGANYGSGYSLRKLSAALEKIDFDIDFNSLKP